tara:strand:+ start:356 stop:502 length:147 start_codon:yes stop_codon:yes gene_type:complete
MNRLQKLNEILEIAQKFNNLDMVTNIKVEIEKEKENPSDVTYPDPTND